ncbi:MAG TPA: HEAT repeat domain-containing protein, partial [Planctomycetota bacterium]|nr:HEAT repeat domain-containing protein [Planctomycetota bacterium]
TLPPILLAALADTDPRVRAAAAALLGRVRAEGARATLLARLETDPDERVREGAILGLLHLRDPSLAPELRRRAEDAAENPRVRGYAVLALGFVGEGDFARTRFLDEPTEADRRVPAVLRDLQACAVRGLALAPHEGDAQYLALLLSDRRRPPEVRGHAGPALLRVRAAAALPVLRSVLAERDGEESADTARVGACVAWPGCAALDDRAALHSAQAVLKEVDGRFGGVRSALADALGSMRGPSEARLLVEEYERCRGDTRRPAERGWFLLAIARAGTSEARAYLLEEMKRLDHERDLAACALALAIAGEARGVALIRERLAAAKREFVPWGILALGILDDRGGPALIREIVERRREGEVIGQAAVALSLILGQKALPDLLELRIRCRDNAERDRVADAFRIAAGPKTVDALVALARDPAVSGDDRAFVLLALARIADADEPPLLDLFRREHNPYAGAPTLDGLARHGEFEPIRRLER